MVNKKFLNSFEQLSTFMKLVVSVITIDLKVIALVKLNYFK